MAIVMPWSRALCPFCFHRFHLSEAPRRLTSGPKVPDQHVGRFFEAPAPGMYQVEPPPSRAGIFKRLFRSFVVSDDWKGNAFKICPNCHLTLPHATARGRLSSEIIAIIGDRGSGKSNYFGVLIRELEKIGPKVGFTIRDQETFYQQEMRSIHSAALHSRRYGTLFGKDGERRAIGQTLRASQNPDLRVPLIYRLEFEPRWFDWMLRPFSTRRSLDLVIFDAAGEDMRDNNPETLSRFYRYISTAFGIIFLIDPVQCAGIRNQLPADLQRRFPRETFDQAQVVSSVINLFQQHGYEGKSVPVPIAFAFAKADLFKGMVDRSAQLLRDPNHDGGFDENDCRKLSEQMKAYLERWHSNDLLNASDPKMVRTSCFFALTALGQTPEEGTMRINEIAARRVVDPILWLLWRRGYIGARETGASTGGRAS